MPHGSSALRSTRLALLATVFVLGGCSRKSGESTAHKATTTGASIASTSAKQPGVAPRQIAVYYFHGERRCKTCVGIQETIERTLEQRFAAEMGSAVLSFQVINMDQPEHAHFVKDFDLSSGTMVVAAKNGAETLRWQNCDEVWRLARDKASLAQYTEQRIRSYLDLVKGS